MWCRLRRPLHGECSARALDVARFPPHVAARFPRTADDPFRRRSGISRRRRGIRERRGTPARAAMERAGKLDRELIDEVLRDGHDGDRGRREVRRRRRLAHDGGDRASRRSARSIPRPRSSSTSRTRSSTIRSLATAPTTQATVPAATHSEGSGAYALSEPGSGSDAFGMRRAPRSAGQCWVLNGRKLWITNGAEAEIYVVFANANPSKGYKGITAFVVERGFTGFSVGKKEDKLGIRASSTTELILDDVEVPAAERARPGRPGLQDRDRDAERRTHRHRRADDRRRRRARCDAATEYVKERTQFGKKLADFQGDAVPARAGAHGARGGAAHGLQRRAPQGRRTRHREGRRRWRSSSRRRSPSA